MSTTTINQNGRTPRALFSRIAALLCINPIARPIGAIGREYRRRSSAPVLCALLAVCLLLPAAVMADPLPLSTEASGTVSGGLYVGAFGHNNDYSATTIQQFSIPAFTDVAWARLEMVGYAGGTDAHPGTFTVTYDADSDGTYETTVGATHVDAESSMDDEVYVAGTDADRNYSDYRVWFDVTSLITTQNPTVKVVTAMDGSSLYYNIKELALVVAYNDGDSDQVKYWVNTGHQYVYSGNEYTGQTGFDTTTVPAGFTEATLTNIALSSSDATYTFNDNSKASGTPSSYFVTNTWDVTGDLTAGSSSTFVYTKSSGSYKTTLAALAVKCPAPVEAPVAQFAADVVSGTAPLTVTFTDQSTNTPTSWAWTIEGTEGTDYQYVDSTSSASQNPHVEFLVAGTYDVTLVATNAGGSDDEAKTDYITVTAAGPKTWYVDTTGAGDFTAIQPAIDAASPGDTIFIRAGTYAPDALEIPSGKNDITLQGESAGLVTIALSNADPALARLIVESAGVTIRDLTFQSCHIYLGYGGAAATGTVISNNVFLNPVFDDGGAVFIAQTATNNILRNNVFSGATGAYNPIALYGDNTVVVENTIAGSTGSGLTVYSDSNTITKNTFSNNAYAGIEFFSDGFSCENNRIYLNSFTGNGVTATTTGTTPPATTYWVSPEAVSYTYNGNTYTGILGNYWDADYTGTDADGNGVGDTAYTVPDSLGSDTAPLMGAWDGSGITGPAVEAPVAAFSADPTSGTVPLTVHFTDESTNDPTSRVWDFGDGNSSWSTTETTFAHTYDATGTYDVTLAVENSAGSDSEAKEDFITVNSAGPLPDLQAVHVSINPSDYANGNVFERESNNILAYVKNNGPGDAPASVLQVTASDGFSGTASVPALTSGSETYVIIEDTTIRPTAGATLTYTATADPEDLIAEADEGNNALTSPIKVVKFNGYKGKRYMDGGSDVTTYMTYDLHGNLIHSFGDGAYRSGSFGSGWYSYDTHWTASDLPIPSGATVREVRLYVPYTWDYEQRAPDQITLGFNGVTVPYQNWYHDVSNFGTYSTHTYGLMTYDVTSIFVANGDNTATFTRPGFSDAISPYGFTLAVVYEDPTMTRKQIFMNEEFDLLGASTSSYATTEEEATAYIPFTGPTIDTANVMTANLITFVPSGYGPEGKLLFNGDVIATHVWGYSGGGQGTQVAVDTRDVKAYLDPTGNEAGISGENSPSPCLAASQQFLVVEYPDAPVAAFSATPVTGIVPLTVIFTDESTSYPTSRIWDFGDGNSSWSTTETTFTHTYESEGTYDVTLAVENSAGSDSEFKDDYITVTLPDPPVAAFSATPVTGVAPLTVIFTDESTSYLTSRVWDFGDGNSSWSTTETTFAHTYESEGMYDVTLTVENSAGSDSEVKEDYITVTAVVTIPGQTNPPTDPDSDGLYEDLNANDRKDFNDVYLFYKNMEWMSENEPIVYFDFNGNGRLDFNDLFVLYKEMV